MAKQVKLNEEVDNKTGDLEQVKPTKSPKKNYYLCVGKSVLTLKGILSNSDMVTAEHFKNKQQSLDYLLDKGVLEYR